MTVFTVLCLKNLCYFSMEKPAILNIAEAVWMISLNVDNIFNISALNV